MINAKDDTGKQDEFGEASQVIGKALARRRQTILVVKMIRSAPTVI